MHGLLLCVWRLLCAVQPPGYSNYAPTLQSDSDHEMQRDEQYQMEEAMRRSRQVRASPEHLFLSCSTGFP